MAERANTVGLFVGAKLKYKHWVCPIAQQETNALECYNLTIDEDDDPRNISIPDSEGHCEVHGPAVEAPEVT